MADRCGAQLSLMDALEGTNKWARAYQVWRERSPTVFELYKRFAREALGRGKVFSISLLTERIRWEAHMADAPGPKINNNFRAYIARDLLAEIPELAGILELRAVAGNEQDDR